MDELSDLIGSVLPYSTYIDDCYQFRLSLLPKNSELNSRRKRYNQINAVGRMKQLVTVYMFHE